MEVSGSTVPLVMVLPFAAMLVAIAFLPLVAEHFWERNRNKGVVTALLALPTVIYLIASSPSSLLHSVIEYVSFIALLGALYVVAGGIHVTGDLQATPRTNTAILAFGAVLANFVGTTGASMLLIRMLLLTNQERKQIAHVPFFFILVVANCGGLLTPLGDPPLFLGYLRGVPFTWTLGLWPYWLLVNGYLLAVFYVTDVRAYRRERLADIVRDVLETTPLRVTGLGNVPLLAGVVGCVFMPSPVRELGMLVLAMASIFATKQARLRNQFNYGPILEVAILFAGIFVTMVPALALLEARGSQLGLTESSQFFLVTGLLSSILDNAPTYLTFLSTAQGLGLSPEVVGIPDSFLVAISLGAVLMGANTYIGNGPNFMVKAIAERAGVRMPSFAGYAGRAVLTLLPAYIVIVFLFRHSG